MAGFIPVRILASPTAILESFWILTASGELPINLLISLARVLVGSTVAVIAGMALGLLAGLSRTGEDAVDATLQMIRTVPFLAVIPLFILWFGIDEGPKVGLVALGAFFPIYINLFAGVRGVDVKLLEAGRVFGLNQRGLIWNIVLPGALPSFFVGLRYAFGVAWLSLVAAEQINAQSGIGYMIMEARDFLRTDVILVGLMVYSLLGLATDGIVRVLERSALAWRPSIVR
jgi:sulfonate transport system permease protein